MWSSGLDYDTGAKTYYLNLVLRDAADRFGNRKETERTLVVDVQDVADQDPFWVEPCYPLEVNESYLYKG